MKKIRKKEQGKCVRNKGLQMQEENGCDHADQKVKCIQMLLWAGVILIQLFVVGNMQVQAMEQEPDLEEQNTVTINSRLWDRPEDCPAPEENYTAEDGTQYELISWETEPVTVPAREELVEEEGFCGQVEGMSKVPETAVVTVWERGQPVEVVCQLAEKAVIQEEWQDGFYFPVTFHGYDAGIYWLKGHLISGSEETPRLDGCEELLLEEIGAASEEYRILGIRWDGDAYEDGSGEICRKAEAFGQKLVRDYELLYKGIVKLPAYRAWRTSAVYEPVKAEEPEKEREPEIEEFQRGTVQTEETQPASETEQVSLWERITQTLLITVALGAVLFFGGLLLLALVWLRRMFLPYGKEEKEQL